VSDTWHTNIKCPNCYTRGREAYLAMQGSFWPSEFVCSFFKVRCRTCGLVLEGKGIADKEYEGKWQTWLGNIGAKHSSKRSTSIGQKIYGGGGVAKPSARRVKE
jgi:hypothetical protein